jgi:hypothetical protein
MRVETHTTSISLDEISRLLVGRGIAQSRRSMPQGGHLPDGGSPTIYADGIVQN